MSLNNSYIIVLEPSVKPITVDEVKDHLKISCNDTSEDLEISLMICAAVKFAEKYTGRTFINTTFKTYRENFCCEFLMLRSKLQSVTSINYLKDDVLTLVPSTTYSITDETDFGRIYLKNGESWPSDQDCNPQAIEIIFVAGYGEDASDVPCDLRLGLLNHVASIYSDRGDCSDDLTNTVAKIPNATKLVYDMCKIRIV